MLCFLSRRLAVLPYHDHTPLSLQAAPRAQDHLHAVLALQANIKLERETHINVLGLLSLGFRRTGYFTNATSAPSCTPCVSGDWLWAYTAFSEHF